MFPALWKHIAAFALYTIAFFPSIYLLYYVTLAFLKEKHRPGQIVPFTVLIILSWCCNRLIVLYMSGFNVFSTLLWHAIILWGVFHRRGLSLLLDSIKLMLMTILLELCCTLVIALLHLMGVNDLTFVVMTLDDMLNLGLVFTSSLINCLGTVMIILGITLWEKLRSSRELPKETRRQQRLYTRSILRVSGLMLAALSLLAMPHFLFGNDISKFLPLLDSGKYPLMIFFVVLLLFVSASYMAQDIRYIMQTKRLNTLEQQQNISRSLLQNLRHFRHNMANMLYGLEGVLISGDREQVLDYYDQMREKCALVNNENIAALERIANPSVSAVLLNGVDKARQRNLPIHLYVQEAVTFGSALRDADLCQVLGVLQDNAIEAADNADERFVSIEIRNISNATEIIIKNTYSGDIDPSTLTHGGASTKEGHSGHGLESCYHILSRRKGAFLNFWVTGQYVQAQLLLEQ